MKNCTSNEITFLWASLAKLPLERGVADAEAGAGTGAAKDYACRCSVNICTNLMSTRKLCGFVEVLALKEL